MVSFSEWWPYLRDSTALVGASFALHSFRRAQRQRRAEWLSGLYSQFFETAHYKAIRRILDYETEPELSELRECVEAGEYSELSEQFVDYLNFFEYLGSLRELGQISSEEISLLFEYYIHRLHDHEFVDRFARAQGFERLTLLLDECRRCTANPRAAAPA
ncbi:MAG: hypothetical protein K2X99_03030 [Gemmatimonadaceae bacterium]|nr:hypothetical protein [Gemmatimonadaceae bacterium]